VAELLPDDGHDGLVVGVRSRRRVRDVALELRGGGSGGDLVAAQPAVDALDVFCYASDSSKDCFLPSL
jgi:hypothetical protein